jgi:hypothetical protein
MMPAAAGMTAAALTTATGVGDALMTALKRPARHAAEVTALWRQR